MKIGITGISGLIGQKIAMMAQASGHAVVGFSRKTDRRVAHCDDLRNFSLEQPINLAGVDVLIHLAGESIMALWTQKKRRQILESRRDTTRALVRAIAAAEVKPSALLCASGTGIYGDRGDQLLDDNAPAGKGFLAEVAEVWEQEATAAAQAGVRVCSLRTSMILSPDGGAFPLLRTIFKLGLGAKLGSGKQFMPWLHIDDIAALYLFCAENREISGPVNASAPGTVTNEDFSRTLAEVLHRPVLLPAPAFLFKALLRDQASLLLDSEKVVPTKALAHGYSFRYPTLGGALENLTR